MIQQIATHESLAYCTSSTDAQFREYISEVFLSDVNSTDVDRVLQLYPSDPAAGSPFDTGDANVVTPEYKRISAFIGDIVFQAPRRLLMQSRSGKQDTWSFCELLHLSLEVDADRCLSGETKQESSDAGFGEFGSSHAWLESGFDVSPL